MSEGPRVARPGLSVVLGFAGVIGLIVVTVYARSEQMLGRRHVQPSRHEALAVEVDEALLERGRHLVTVVAQCTYCHGPDLAGREMADDPLIGRLYAANLTRGQGGIAGRYRDADWIAALRHGIAPDGRSLLLMPSAGLSRLSERDLAAIVAYVRQVPAVDRDLPPKRMGWLTRAVVAAGLAPDLISAEQVTSRAPQDERTTSGSGAVDVAWLTRGAVWAFDPGLEARTGEASAAYGAYLVEVGSCRVCHRTDLAGGLHPLSLPGEPVPPDLTANGPLARWTLGDFKRAMREGRTPDGRTLDRAFMPWPAFAGLDDVELEAIWLYLGLGREFEGPVRAGKTGAGEENGAAKKTRTSTGLLPPAPQAGASTNSATAARGRGA